MKILITLLLAFSFLGCKKDSETMNGVGFGDYAPFTITHKANYNEEVIIYLSDEKVTPTKVTFGFSPYRLKPNECLKLKASQFDELIVRVGVGVSLTSALKNKPACSPPDKQICTPGNYEILDTGEWGDEYEMKALHHPNTSNDCIDIEQWMQQKKQKV